MNNKFDYIIVGAGTAGCVLANRLSADVENSVLLIEAGGSDKKLLIKTPGAYPQNFKTNYDWGFWSEPQEHIDNRKIYLPRGKVFGGCSSINAMAYVRGNKADYDGWAAMGNKGWSYEEVLPYFIKSEHNDVIDQLDEGYHGTNGELNVTHNEYYRTPLAEAFVEAGKQMGYPENKDYNGKAQKGVGYFQVNIKQGKRHSAAVAFLYPALKRSNFTARRNCLVTKVMLENDVAKGVEFLAGKKTEKAYANKAVILAAGAFNSPQILMLSGIGDPGKLSKHGIQTKQALPGVGQNLQDHLFFQVSASASKNTGVNRFLHGLPEIGALLQYLFTGKGPTSMGPLEAVIFSNIDGKDAPANFQYHFVPFHVGKDYDYDAYDKSTFPKSDGFTILPSLLHPKSRGYVELRSGDPKAPPVIQPNFFSEEEDLLTLVKGTKKALELINAPAFDPYRKEILAPHDHSSDEAIIKHIKKAVETIYHPVGTCKMGDDEMAVVDNQLRVHGIENLFVADASIMPKIVTGNTNAPVNMIAEKASDMILAL
ncbi:MAG: GMC family oxidoreductase N-terminal domain-containing protein [Bacteroidota bacterium]